MFRRSAGRDNGLALSRERAALPHHSSSRRAKNPRTVVAFAFVQESKTGAKAGWMNEPRGLDAASSRRAGLL